jgi:hypothetical protein
MKVGFSYSRCMVDIIEGRVKEDEILVIISRTDFNPHNANQWNSIWRGYTNVNSWSNDEWRDYRDREQEFKELTIRLYDEGKLHQPRQFGAWPQRVYDIWAEVK